MQSQLCLWQGPAGCRISLSAIRSGAVVVSPRYVSAFREPGGAVQNASLSSHEQGFDAVAAERRKDFVNRAPAQASLRVPGRLPGGPDFFAGARPASDATTRRPPGPSHLRPSRRIVPDRPVPSSHARAARRIRRRKGFSPCPGRATIIESLRVCSSPGDCVGRRPGKRLSRCRISLCTVREAAEMDSEK